MEKSHCDWLHCQASDIDTERVEKPTTNPNLDRRGRARGQVYWEETSWALHLVATNEENASMDVAFHWLPTLGNSERKASDKDLIPETGAPVSWQRYRHWQSLGEGNYLHCEKSVIRFGQIFTIPTDDPLDNPLQSKGIARFVMDLDSHCKEQIVSRAYRWVCFGLFELIIPDQKHQYSVRSCPFDNPTYKGSTLNVAQPQLRWFKRLQGLSCLFAASQVYVRVWTEL